ncbi:MAG: tRNA-intron lyase [Candidatus Lokiarchaeota archaeon]|nr:tRNA-intron lyase [Candidatus Lokiarchaeota archaeon]MBD3200547.1 tRNA-intron lyase [Candidatus Lokiarchaeota archaeon]
MAEEEEKANDQVISLDEIDESDIPDRIPTKFINSRVVIFNPLYASYLYVKKGFFGAPLGINKPRLEYFSKPSELSLIEAYFLLKNDKITIFDVENEKNLESEEFYEIAKSLHDKFEEKFVIYKDLREKGYIPRPGLKFGADFVVYKKGPGLEHSPFIVHVMPHNSNISAVEMVRAGRLATSVRKKFVIANPLTTSYYFFEWFKP